MSVLDEKNLEVDHVESLSKTMTGEAQFASQMEHDMTIREAFRLYKKAVFWAVVVSGSIIMEGYDTALLGSFWAFPSFAKRFGEDFGGTKGYQIAAPWQAGLSNASVVGTIVGIALNGQFSTRYGYRPVLLGSMCMMVAVIFASFFAPSIEVLLVGQFLCGIPWGVFSTSAPAYASEVAPTVLRGYLTTYVNLCWAIGQFIAAGVLKGLLTRTDDLGWRIPFAVQWAWPPFLIVAFYFMPESPWYLVRRGKFEEAEQSIRRLRSEEIWDKNGAMLAMIKHTNEIEIQVAEGTSYIDAFRGVDRRRTEIACVVFACQVLSGSTFAYSATYFMTQAGLSTEDAYSMGLGGTAIAFCGTCLSWLLITKFGRRSLYVFGLSVLTLTLILIGVCLAASNSKASLWSQSALALFWLFTYSSTVGPVCYSLVAEMSSMRLRAKSVALARASYQVVNVCSNVIQPYLINPSQANLRGKCGFVWAVTCGLAAIWAYFRLPEPKGLTPAELDVLFAKKVSARNFSRTQVAVYEGDADEIKQTYGRH